jgi:hypothetical protein
MKVRLTAISEEDLVNMPASATAATPSPFEKVIVARLAAPDVPGYYGIHIPYKVIEGAQVGDEFTLHLERVPKA